MYANIDSKTSGKTPGDFSLFPNRVYVLPELVCPNPNMLTIHRLLSIKPTIFTLKRKQYLLLNI
jgi:hypothetical protein